MEYLLKSTAILSIFYVFYKMFLQNETFFKSIRIYFLIGFISAIVIPFIIIPKYIIINPLEVSVNTFGTSVNQNTQLTTFDWSELILIIYLIGVLLFTLRFFVQISSLVSFLYKKPKKESIIW